MARDWWLGYLEAWTKEKAAQRGLCAIAGIAKSHVVPWPPGEEQEEHWGTSRNIVPRCTHYLGGLPPVEVSIRRGTAAHRGVGEAKSLPELAFGGSADDAGPRVAFANSTAIPIERKAGARLRKRPVSACMPRMIRPKILLE